MVMVTIKESFSNIFRKRQDEVYAPNWENVSVDDSEFSDEQTRKREGRLDWENVSVENSEFSDEQVGKMKDREKCWRLQEMMRRYMTGSFVFTFTIVIAAIVSIILVSTSSSSTENNRNNNSPIPGPTPSPTRLSLPPPTSSNLGDLDLSNLVNPTSPPPSPDESLLFQDQRSQAILERIQVLSGDLVMIPQSPQKYAAFWILDDDTLQLDASSPFLIQRYVMAVIYYALHGYSATRGHDWMKAGTQECSWTGVKCNENSFVTRLELPNMGLLGSIPKEISGLPHLNYLDLSFNHIFGSIPNEFGVMNNLEFLYLDRNDITGNVEKSICDLRKKGTLQKFTVDCDESTLKIRCDCCTNCGGLDELMPLPTDTPPTESESELRKKGIETVLSVVSGVHLHDIGSPQEKAFQWIIEDDNLQLDQFDKHLPQRYVMALMYFQLSGQMWKTKGWLSPNTSECFYFGITCNRNGNIMVIKLDHQNLMGFLPGEISAIHSLRSINLNENLIEGIIPADWSKLYNLEKIHLHGNMIGGTVPPELCDLRSGKLSQFVVDCDLIPCSCCTNCLHVSNNGATNQISSIPAPTPVPTRYPMHPSSVIPPSKTAPLLAPADHPTNDMNCLHHFPNDLPNEYQSSDFFESTQRFQDLSKFLKGVTKFHLGLDCWSREIALHWISNIDAQKLDINDPKLIQRYVLAVLYFNLHGYNWTIKPWLSGAIDECEWKGIKCSSDGDVVSIVLKSGNLKGLIPYELEQLHHLVVLDLSDNHVSGNIPGEIQYLANLSILRLYSNELVGQVADGICMLKEMGDLSEIWVDCEKNSKYYVSCKSLCCDKCGQNTYPAGHPPIFVFTSAPTMQPTEFNPFVVKKCPKKTGEMTMAMSIAEKLKKVSKNNQEELFLLEGNKTDTLVSARGKALNWLIHDDGLGIEDCQDNLEQRYIVALLYFSLNGNDWTHKNNGWLSESTFECEWNGIGCDKAGQIKAISLKEFGLDGTIPYEVSSLSNLKALDMSNNFIKGQIPNQIENLVNLEILILYNNHMTGSVPENICSLEGQGALKYLWVDCDESSDFQVTCDCCTKCSDIPG